ncbi:MAG: energy-coupling factor ABC transporter substrate-binding protein [Clostridiaceae bacterium]|uniref:energy-coupling factor ABC transporter substrate-binding protein n=1 Tax=Clostridium sp. cpc1 TaxID=2016536 RepID=UPI00223F64FB|nr:energy-coupling factor ABC transporter substrate-binding protein [Clostridium sp. cpc1]MBW4828131.1 energy-coupling factor ABC transporter substrate-binding protein [Clostridiaceae bacterium]MBW4860908.1 energy-coupling factor ABC transporter substrate-binding protein [Clostridiaceae bacterium]MBW4867533.1 energy-coupling factor ABC transporter substrate-binding protein [Clostridiaceae bacterium]MCW7999997.1 cobalt ABC transporter substrate-binding protein CbiN [Clostridium sp. cpc1]
MKSSSKKNILLLILAVIIVITPLILKGGSEFEGADDQAEGIIEEINPDYEPWFESLWEPPSGEIESLLFSVQVAIGAGLIGYILGNMKGKKQVASDR